MGLAQISRRVKRLSAAIQPAAVRSYSLEGICREYWRQDASAFEAFVERECPVVGVFRQSFRHESAEAVAGDRGTR
jgi:hypothetical protein